MVLRRIDYARDVVGEGLVEEVDMKQLLFRLRLPHMQILFVVGHISSNSQQITSYYVLGFQKIDLTLPV